MGRQIIGTGLWSAIKAALNSNFTELYNQSIVPTSAGIDVYIENEVLENCERNVWYSPTTAQLTGMFANNFEYAAGSLTYIGTDPIKVILISSVSISIAGGLNADVESTCGKNGSPNLICAMPATSTFNGKVNVGPTCIFDLVTGDTLDFFFMQTSETGTPDITINKGKFTILKIG